METAKKIHHDNTRNIIQTTPLIATQSTVEWLQKLYDCGAVTFWPDGHITVQPEIREVIQAMHAILAGGKVKVEIVQDGGEHFDKLEQLFDSSLDEVNAAHMHQNMSDEPLPVSP